MMRRRAVGGVANGWRLAVALIVAAFGLAIAGLGVWLILLGGSWYYFFAGVGLLATSWLMLKERGEAVWLYVAIYAATFVWAVWESGANGWAQVPRLIAPTVVLALIISTLPALVGARKRLAAITGMVIALVGGGGLIVATQEQPVVAAVPVKGEPTPGSASSADWTAYGGTHHATRFSALEQITPNNVGSLEEVWTFRTGDMPEGEERFSNQNTPLKIGNQLLICSAMNKIISVDAATGNENWRFDPEVANEAIPYNATCRGLAYHDGGTGECAERVIMNTMDARLIAVDIQTGNLCQSFGDGGTVDLLEGIGTNAPGWYAPSSPPTIVRNVAVVHSQVRDNQRRDAPSGVVRGYDVATGELRWAWDMGRPDEKGLPAAGETYTRGTPNVWTISSGDDQLGHVYLPLGNSSVDYWGAMRSEAENTYSTSLVALDVETGDVAWHYQTVRYDVWDYDLGSQGTLVDFPTDDGPVPALILPTKLGMFWVFDRRTGELLVEVQDRPVPQGGVEPENLSPTQPFVTDFPSALKPDIEEHHMWGMTPLDQLWCRIEFRRSNYDGIYTPPSAGRHWIQYPGYNGGSDWGGIAVDPTRGIMVANYNNTANRNMLIPREEADALGVIPLDQQEEGHQNPDNYNPQGETPWAIKLNPGWRAPLTGLLCTQPPYGGIMAVDLATREVLWDKPLGTARKNGPFGLPTMLPIDIGTPNNAGSVVTASGLIFIAAATDDLIRAVDIASGKTLWSAPLPAGGQAGPAMFEVEGRQILVINAGGHNFMETAIGDHFVAYALP